MKKLSYFVSMAAMMLFASCSSDTEDFVAENNIADGETVTINVSMPEGEGTRVSTDNIEGLVWEAGDRILINGYDENGMYAAYSWLDIDPNYTGNSKTATFSGILPNMKNKKITSYDLIYHEGDKYWVDQGNEIVDHFDYTIQKQAGINNSAHIKNFFRLMSGKLTAVKNVVMKPYNSILKINLSDIPAELKTADKMDIRFYVNYGDAAQNKNAAITLDGALTTGDNFVYMSFDPKASNDLKGGKDLCLEILTKDYTCTAAVTTDATGVDYQEGKIYTLKPVNAAPWKWNIEKNIPLDPVYTNALNTQELVNEWTMEGSVTNFIQFDEANACMKMFADAWGYFGNVQTVYVVSPNMVLKPEINKVSFDHSASMSGPATYLKLVIRTIVDGKASAWAPLTIETYSQNGFINSGKIKIPDEYKGQTVQIGFKNEINTQAHFKNHEWMIKNFAVKGI